MTFKKRGGLMLEYKIPYYPILVSKMAEKGMKIEHLAKLINVTSRQTRRKLNGEVDFWLKETMKIQETYFPEVPIYDLFKTIDASSNSA